MTAHEPSKRGAKKPHPPAALALIAGMGRFVLPRKKRPTVRPKLLVTENRFASKAGHELTEIEIEFGAAMARYLERWGSAGWTCGQVLDVLLSLGYRNPERDFDICVCQFTSAIFTLKRGGRRKDRRPFPTWGEVLRIAMRCGWYRGPKP